MAWNSGNNFTLLHFSLWFVHTIHKLNIKKNKMKKSAYQMKNSMLRMAAKGAPMQKKLEFIAGTLFQKRKIS